MSTFHLIQEPFCHFCDPLSVGLLAFCCGPLGVAIAHCGIRRGINQDGCKGFALTCCLCCIGAALNRKALRLHFNVGGSCICECVLYMCCYCCLVTQEYRRMKKGPIHQSIPNNQ